MVHFIAGPLTSTMLWGAILHKTNTLYNLLITDSLIAPKALMTSLHCGYSGCRLLEPFPALCKQSKSKVLHHDDAPSPNKHSAETYILQNPDLEPTLTYFTLTGLVVEIQRYCNTGVMPACHNQCNQLHPLLSSYHIKQSIRLQQQGFFWKLNYPKRLQCWFSFTRKPGA